jgi:hypothetical protein
MILTCDFTKQRLWLGEPCLIGTALEPDAEEIIEPTDSQFERRGTSFVLKDEPPGYVLFRRLQPADTSDWVKPAAIPGGLPRNVIGAESLDLGSGVFQVQVMRGPERAILPDLIWILERDDYVSLARSEATEDFEVEPTVSAPDEFRRFFLRTVFDRWPYCPTEFDISYASDFPVSYSPIAWVASHILDAFRYLAVFGIRSSSGFVSVGDSQVEFGINAELEYPVSERVIQAFNDPECSDLVLMKGTSFLDGYDLKIELQYNHVKIAVRQPTPALETAS